MKLKLSIIIPVYNVEKYIERCLDSVFSQREANDGDDVEIIVVNDGTPDNSMKVVEKLAAKHSNLTIINQENQGLSAARNAGLKAAHGKYVWFVDSDDWLLNGALKDVIDVISNHSEIDVISHPLLQVFEKNGAEIPDMNTTPQIVTGKDYLFNWLNQGAVQRFILRKDFLDMNHLKFTEGIIHEDAEFGLRMLYKAHKIMVQNHCIYAYRIRECGSIMSSWSSKSPYSLLEIYKRLLDFCEKEVIKEDQSEYHARILQCFDDALGFARRHLYTDEFKNFYSENRKYIHEESVKVLKSHPKGRNRCVALKLAYYPLLELKVKYFLRKILKR